MRDVWLRREIAPANGAPGHGKAGPITDRLERGDLGSTRDRACS